MSRYLVGAVSALLLVAAGAILFSNRSKPGSLLPPAPAMALAAQENEAAAAPVEVPAAPEKTREQKRFDRYDHDRNGTITREEYLLARHKAFAKLAVNHGGMLSFDEWAVKTETKFSTADRDHSGTLDAAEFATTTVKRKTRPLRRDCPPAVPQPAPAEVDQEG
jgi:hypothetical protein